MKSSVKKKFSISLLLSCLREQHPDREDVIAALGQIGKGYWKTDCYFDLSYDDGIYSTDVGSTYKESIIVWFPGPEWSIVLVDVLEDGSVVGIEFVPKTDDPLSGYIKLDGRMVLHHTQYDKEQLPLWDAAMILPDEEDDLNIDYVGSIPRELLLNCGPELLDMAVQILWDTPTGEKKNAAFSALKFRFDLACSKIDNHPLVSLFSYGAYTARYRNAMGNDFTLKRIYQRTGYLMYYEVREKAASLVSDSVLVVSPNENRLFFEWAFYQLHTILHLESGSVDFGMTEIDRAAFETLIPNDSAAGEYVEFYGFSNLRFLLFSQEDVDTACMLSGDNLLLAVVFIKHASDDLV